MEQAKILDDGGIVEFGKPMTDRQKKMLDEEQLENLQKYEGDASYDDFKQVIINNIYLI